MICAFSSSRRNRAAADAPPATPPTIRIFLIIHRIPFRHKGGTKKFD